ncbi:leucyl/phenylalanyl-tRNA--protein transferase [Porphyrobacter algicida]|uniref:Leucyl/phenylalanyl-tRNA--protein transferase n=1 Tax=Qipengyuania algicida TaxID=1836209 RepID=A0A845AFH2_9SPHN|nr:leucyl/phenylalanyl-tRNA--protein transferase [Qipengyuania algicida]MXP28169.1 leucyl/phenylalanyl-tRNA--protein transferase [Qipengyuania algicida]
MHSPARPVDRIPPELLLRAYRAGIFPMADFRDDPEVFWVEPRERAIIPVDGFHLSRSLAKTLRRDRFWVTCDADFAGVIAACAAPREELAESWISERIEASYRDLFASGHAHSIECWSQDQAGEQQLVGGLYGVAFDRVFCGESMFSRATDASKVALAWLVAGLRQAGYRLLDCQFITDHLASLGAVTIAQQDYLKRVQSAQGTPRCSLPQALGELVDAGEGDEDGFGAASPGKRIEQFLTQTS